MKENDTDKFETKWVYYKNRKFLHKDIATLAKDNLSETFNDSQEGGVGEVAVEKESLEIIEEDTAAEINREDAAAEILEESILDEPVEEILPGQEEKPNEQDNKEKSVFTGLGRLYAIYQKKKEEK